MKRFSRRYLRKLIMEALKNVTGATTVGELIAAGLLPADFLEKVNKKLGRAEQKIQKQAGIDANYDLAKYIIANFLVNSYVQLPDPGADLEVYKTAKGADKKRYAFGKKPVEKKVQEIFDALGISYPSGFGPGTPRGYVNDVFAELESANILTSNRELVSNQAHTRNFMLKSPAAGLERPDMSGFDDDSGLPDPDKIKESFWRKGRYPLLREIMENTALMGPMSFDDIPDEEAMSVNEMTSLDELAEMGYVSQESMQLLMQGEPLDYEYEISDITALESIANDQSAVQELGPDQIDMIMQMI